MTRLHSLVFSLALIVATNTSAAAEISDAGKAYRHCSQTFPNITDDGLLKIKQQATDIETYVDLLLATCSTERDGLLKYRVSKGDTIEAAKIKVAVLEIAAKRYVRYSLGLNWLALQLEELRKKQSQ